MANRRRRLPLVLFSTLLGLAHGEGAVADDPPTFGGSGLELAPEAPADPSLSADLSELEPPTPFYDADVVIVIDNSTLSLVASGIDVDGDGKVGRTRESVTHYDPLAPSSRMWTTDSGDTVQQLQLRIATSLVPRLAARKNRVGLLSVNLRSPRWYESASHFVIEPEVLVPVGPPGRVLAALEDFPRSLEHRRTDLRLMIDRGATMLDVAATELAERRPREMLLLYVGEPSAPDGVHWSSQRALEAADEFGERGIRIWAVPVLPGDTKYLDQLTGRTGGETIPLDQLDQRFGVIWR